MPKPRGADRNTETLPIGEDDHIIVFTELTAGEEADAMQGAIVRLRDDDGIETVEQDRKALLFTTAARYIQSWSFIDRAGAPLVWPLSIRDRVEILRTQLSGSDWAEVLSAIKAHEAAQDAKKKRTPAGKSGPTTT